MVRTRRSSTISTNDTLLAVDPGKWMSGCALLDVDTGALLGMHTAIATRSVDAGAAAWHQAIDLMEWLETLGLGVKPGSLVVEWPDLRENRGRDPTALAYLFATAGAFSYALGRARIEVQPVSWKGSVPKEIMLARILSHLTEEELKMHTDLAGVIGVDSASHSVDAVGLGKWYWKTKMQG